MNKLDAQFYSLLLDVIDTAIFSVDRDGLITFFSRAAERTTGYRAEEVIGRRCSSIFKTALCDSDCPLRRTIQSGKRVVDRRVRIKGKDGRSIPVSVTTAVLTDPAGDVLGGVEIITDLSSLEHLKRQLDGRYQFEDIISKSPKMQDIFDLLPLVARSDSTVLISGASGTGKELVARAIHHQGNRGSNAFVAVNCAAMPETLIESELFGYVRGAFTDAKRNKPGRIAQADGGTLFLDEVGDLPLPVQVKLLRFLQERIYEPLGATYSTRADVRIISATHRNLAAMAEEGTFRQDLYFRLNVMQIELPPLCERSEDIPLLVQHFIQRFRNTTGNRIEAIDQMALSALMSYSFPGNVRELENIIERAFILCRQSLIGLEHLPDNVLQASEATRGEVDGPVGHNGERLDRFSQAERRTIVDALIRHRGNRSKAAKDLGIHRTTLHRKIRRYAIEVSPSSNGTYG